MPFKIFVSHDLGATYNQQLSVESLDDQSLVDLRKELDDNLLRYYITDDQGVTVAWCKLLSNLAEYLGGTEPYKQRPIETHVQELSSRFVGKKPQRKRIQG